MTEINAGRPSSPLDTSVLDRIDPDEFEAAMRRMATATEQFAGSFGNAMRIAVMHGGDFDDALKRIGMRMSSMALDQALQPLQRGLANLLSVPAGSPAQASVPASGAGLGQQQGFNFAAPQLSMNVFTNDARSFRNSRGQLFAALTGILGQGMRNL